MLNCLSTGKTTSSVSCKVISDKNDVFMYQWPKNSFFLLGYHNNNLYHPWWYKLISQLLQFCCMAILWHDDSRTDCDEVHKERTGKAYQGRCSAPNVTSAFDFLKWIRDHVNSRGILFPTWLYFPLDYHILEWSLLFNSFHIIVYDPISRLITYYQEYLWPV